MQWSDEYQYYFSVDMYTSKLDKNKCPIRHSLIESYVKLSKPGGKERKLAIVYNIKKLRR